MKEVVWVEPHRYKKSLLAVSKESHSRPGEVAQVCI